MVKFSEGSSDTSWGEAGKSSSYSPKSSSQPRQVASKRQSLIKVLRFGLWFIVGIVCVLNILPYAGMATRLMEALRETDVVAGLFAEPVIGVFLRAFGQHAQAIAFIVGTIIWAVFQISELFWWLIMSQKPAVAALVDQLENEDYMQIATNEDPFIAKLKEQYNRIPQNQIKMVRMWSGIAYIIDAWFNLLYYPPLNVSLEMFIQSGTFADINWGNVILSLLTLFGVELAIKLIMSVNGIVRRGRRGNGGGRRYAS